MKALPKGIYQLLTWPDKRLLSTSEECTKDDLEDLKKIIKPMVYIMREYSGVGLAAIQIGINKRFCILFNSRTSLDKSIDSDFTSMINPEILEKTEYKDFLEGCLSLPLFSDTKNRANKIKVKYIDLNWEERIIELEGISAQCIQHEIEHMDGKPICLEVSKMKQSIWEKKLHKARKHGKIRL
jgi:peptide deformylase